MQFLNEMIKIKKLSIISQIFIWFNICLILIACNNDKSSEINVQIKEINSFIFKNASNRSTAYIENEKIVNKGKDTFLSFLDFIDNRYKIHIVHLRNDKKIEEIYIDDVVDNHGGGSIALNKDNKLCAVYGGHTSKLKYKCTVKDLNITTWSDVRIIDKNINDIWQTYPSVEFIEESMYILYREENSNAETRNPRLVLIEIADDIVKNKEYIYLTDTYYSNFSSTFFIDKERVDILLMKYGVLKDKNTKFNQGVSLFRKRDSEWLEIKIEVNNTNLEVNYYNSNLVEYNGYLYFIITDMNKSTNFINLYIIDKNNNCKIVNLLNYKTMQEIIKNGNKPNVRIGIDLNEKGEIFFILPFILQDDNIWQSKTNRIHYFKLTSDLEKLELIFKSSASSWLANIEKKVVREDKIPKIVYNNFDKNITIYKEFSNAKQ